MVGNTKLIDQSFNWLTVCPIYANDCIYESMNALNLQVSPQSTCISHTASLAVQGGVVFFWSFDQSTDIG